MKIFFFSFFKCSMFSESHSNQDWHLYIFSRQLNFTPPPPTPGLLSRSLCRDNQQMTLLFVSFKLLKRSQKPQTPTLGNVTQTLILGNVIQWRRTQLQFFVQLSTQLSAVSFTSHNFINDFQSVVYFFYDLNQHTRELICARNT